MHREILTESGVRLRRHNRRLQSSGPDWVLLPGGPGLGSESLVELADLLEGTGNVWLADLPGDGSNLLTGVGDPYDRWPGVIVEAADAVPGAIFVGHSTGGMYLLSVPELEARIAGMVLLSSAPSADWFPLYVEMTRQNPLPAVAAAAEIFERNPTNENLRDIAVASAEWNFTAASLDAGRDLLARMPYNLAAVEWSDKHFDHTYRANWWPSKPVLIVSGAEDGIVAQDFWDDPLYQTPNATRAIVDAAAHFPWIDQPQSVQQALVNFHGVVRQS